jgi:hypothetical protein
MARANVASLLLAAFPALATEGHYDRKLVTRTQLAPLAPAPTLAIVSISG